MTNHLSRYPTGIMSPPLINVMRVRDPASPVDARQSSIRPRHVRKAFINENLIRFEWRPCGCTD